MGQPWCLRGLCRVTSAGVVFGFVSAGSVNVRGTVGKQLQRGMVMCHTRYCWWRCPGRVGAPSNDPRTDEIGDCFGHGHSCRALMFAVETAASSCPSCLGCWWVWRGTRWVSGGVFGMMLCQFRGRYGNLIQRGFCARFPGWREGLEDGTRYGFSRGGIGRG